MADLEREVARLRTDVRRLQRQNQSLVELADLLLAFAESGDRQAFKRGLLAWALAVRERR